METERALEVAETTGALPAPAMRLCFRNARGERDAFALEQRPRTTIGRELGCDVLLSGQHISRHHASIELVLGQYFLRDLESSNGTFLNGLRVSKDHAFALREGDVIEIGSECLTFARLDVSAQLPPALVVAGTATPFPVADLVRDGFGRLSEAARAELESLVERAFVDVPAARALDLCAGLIAERLSVETVTIFMETPDRALNPVAARPSLEAAGSLVALAGRACTTDEARLVHRLAPVETGDPSETGFQARHSIAAIPLSQGPRIRGAIAVERLAGKRLDRADLALLAVFADRIGLMLSLSRASATTPNGKVAGRQP